MERTQKISKFIIYGTTQTHSLGAKAGLILGIPFRALVTSKADCWALKGDTLAQALEEDKAKGLIPFVLLATLGSTSTGAIDDLAQIVKVGE